jgi:hypothetical protein
MARRVKERQQMAVRDLLNPIRVILTGLDAVRIPDEVAITTDTMQTRKSWEMTLPV